MRRACSRQASLSQWMEAPERSWRARCKPRPRALRRQPSFGLIMLLHRRSRRHVPRPDRTQSRVAWKRRARRASSVTGSRLNAPPYRRKGGPESGAPSVQAHSGAARRIGIFGRHPLARDRARTVQRRTSHPLRVVRPVPMVVVGVDMSLGYPPMIPDVVLTSQLADEANAEIADAARQMRHGGYADVDAEVVVADSVAHAIIDFALGHSVDAIAMSTHGRGASRLLMGSVADKIVRASGLPMLLVRPVGVGDESATKEAKQSLVSLAGA